MTARALVVVTTAWVVCPKCRVFAGEVPTFGVRGELATKCPWCSEESTAATWFEAGARDLCECGCPRAAHVRYQTSDRLAPGGSVEQHVMPIAGPCVGCGCVAVSGAREVRLT